MTIIDRVVELVRTVLYTRDGGALKTRDDTYLQRVRR